MRTVIHFTVTGANKAELEAAALTYYRALLDDPEAEFNHTATIEISPSAADLGDTAPGWRGEVTVSENTAGGSR